jgi:UDP-2,3-diacylglucosamine hydrolase
MSKLGILAGGGELPSILMQACRERGWAFHVIALRGQTDPASLAGVPHDWIRMGEPLTAMQRLRAEGADRVVFCGKFHRPSLRDLVPDRWALRFLARIGGRLLSDNRLIEALVKEIESKGFSVIGPADVAASLLARRGPYGRLSPTPDEERAIAEGFAAARRAGRRDVGQAAVVQGGSVIDLEGPDGTDALIARCEARQQGGSGAILVKARKPQQQMRNDPPVIGLPTVQKAAAAGFRGIAVEAGGVLVLQGAALGDAADAAGMFVVGADVPA